MTATRDRFRGAGRPCRCLLAAALLAALALPAPVDAASLAELRAQAQSAGLVPGSGGAGEQAAIDRLGRVALAFLDTVEAEGGAGAKATYEAIAGPLERSYQAHRAALDRLSQAVIDADGSMDEAVESAEWREHQALAAQALYYLNWLRYQGAFLYGGAKRRELLEQSAKGFGEFATAGSENAVVIESHLGRGLAYLELDHPDWAIPDFEAVVRAKGASPERARKARLALADAYIRAGRSADALRASKQALDGATAGDLPRAQLTRARALLMAAAAQPAKRAAYQGEASALLAGLRAGGGPWGNRAAQIVRAGLDNPRNWSSAKTKDVPPPPSEWEVTKQLVAAGKMKKAIPRLERVLAATDEEARKNQPEARYLLGLARYRTGDGAGAIAAFDAVLAEKGKAPWREDAAYLRFKAKEAAYVADPTGERAADFEQTLVAFLRDFPAHKSAPEARFRLGELYQRRERYAEAMTEYGKVAGDPALELRAAFAGAQCGVKLLEQTPEGQKQDPALRRRTGEVLARFWALTREHESKSFGDTPVNELMGQAALMNAYFVAVAEPPDLEQALHFLTDFEERYPKLREQEPQVVKLRLAALVRLDRLSEAARETERPAVAALHPAFLDDLVTRLLTASARQEAGGKTDQAAAGRDAARRLAEAALASKDAETLSVGARQRLRSTLASLYEQGGESEQALALYQALLRDDPNLVSARKGATRLLEAKGAQAEARDLWDQVAQAEDQRAGWLEACYQSARLSIALGESARACALLRKVPPALLAGRSTDTPRKIQDLLRASCAS